MSIAFDLRAIRNLARNCIKALALAVTLCAPDAHASDEASFGRDALEAIRKIYPDRKFRLDPHEPLTIQVKGKGQWDMQSINLDRIFAYCGNVSSGDCIRARDDFLMKVMKPQPEVVKEALRIIVRNKDYVEGVKEAMEKGGGHAVMRPIGDDLATMLAFDAPETLAIASSDDLAKLGLTDDEAWQLALEQTKAVLPVIPMGSLAKGEWAAFDSLDYLGSLLAELDDWQEVSAKVGPDLFTTVASDGLVVMGVLPDGEMLNKLAKVVRQDCESASRCISPHVYRFRDGKWVIAQ